MSSETISYNVTDDGVVNMAFSYYPAEASSLDGVEPRVIKIQMATPNFDLIADDGKQDAINRTFSQAAQRLGAGIVQDALQAKLGPAEQTDDVTLANDEEESDEQS